MKLTVNPSLKSLLISPGILFHPRKHTGARLRTSIPIEVVNFLLLYSVLGTQCSRSKIISTFLFPLVAIISIRPFAVVFPRFLFNSAGVEEASACSDKTSHYKATKNQKLSNHKVSDLRGSIFYL